MRTTNRSLTIALALAGVWVAACKGEAPVTKKADPASETPPAIAALTAEPAATQLAAPMPAAAPSPRPIPPPLSSDAELHVIGIQMGAHPPDADTRPWWAKCGSDRSSEAAADCHRRYAGRAPRVTRPSTVTLTGVPLVLALMGGEPVEWTLNIEPGARVEKVILAGSYAQEIAGIDRMSRSRFTARTSPARAARRSGRASPVRRKLAAVPRGDAALEADRRAVTVDDPVRAPGRH